MPRRYEAMRDKFYEEFKNKGVKDAYDKAQEKAAKIYNATRKPNEPKLNPKHKKK
ncbi:MAG: hypothetical protein N2505_05895 [Endomicrobia bacterium]|nr:hypothetical protein [Endomicrobiia bacterium]